MYWVSDFSIRLFLAKSNLFFSCLLQDILVAYKFRWLDADTEPTDNRLDRQEFMAFRHPEHNKKTLKTMVQNVYKGIGKWH